MSKLTIQSQSTTQPSLTVCVTKLEFKDLLTRILLFFKIFLSPPLRLNSTKSQPQTSDSFKYLTTHNFLFSCGPNSPAGGSVSLTVHRHFLMP